jgi:cysteine dioxygenase
MVTGAHESTKVLRFGDAPNGSTLESTKRHFPEESRLPSSVSDGALLHGRPGLIQLFDRWDKVARPLSEHEIQSGLRQLSLDRGSLDGCSHFNERVYQRTLIHDNRNYEVPVLCWRSGQSSPIHDHGESYCGVLVVEGLATETAFLANQAGHVLDCRSRLITASTMVVSRFADVHPVANLENAGRDLITLHVYSRRLTMTRYFRDEQERLVPESTTSRLLSDTIPAVFQTR